MFSCSGEMLQQLDLSAGDPCRSRGISSEGFIDNFPGGAGIQLMALRAITKQYNYWPTWCSNDIIICHEISHRSQQSWSSEIQEPLLLLQLAWFWPPAPERSLELVQRQKLLQKEMYGPRVTWHPAGVRLGQGIHERWGLRLVTQRANWNLIPANVPYFWTSGRKCDFGKFWK